MFNQSNWSWHFLKKHSLHLCLRLSHCTNKQTSNKGLSSDRHKSCWQKWGFIRLFDQLLSWMLVVWGKCLVLPQMSLNTPTIPSYQYVLIPRIKKLYATDNTDLFQHFPIVQMFRCLQWESVLDFLLFHLDFAEFCTFTVWPHSDEFVWKQKVDYSLLVIYLLIVYKILIKKYKKYLLPLIS